MSSHFTTKRPREEDSDPRPHSTTRHASSKVESSPRLTVQAVAASTVVTSDFDDRILEVFLRGLLRMVAVSQRDAERTTAIIRDVVEVATAREMYVEVYGSARTGIVLPSSDLDFAIVPSSEQHSLATKRHGGGGDNEKRDTVRNSILGRATSGEIELRQQPSMPSTSFAHLSKRERVAIAGQQLHAVVRALQNDRRFTRIRKILHAHVPIIKCVHRASNCEIDFSFTPDGIRSSDYIVGQLAAPELVLGRGLIIIIKSLLSQWSINDPSTGGLGSFPVALMVIWFLRSEGVHYEKGLKNSYAVHLLGFLKYYGEDFDYKNLAIDLVNMCTFKKYCTAEFMIMNPLDTTRNAAKACTRFGSEVRRKFYDAFKTLLNVSLAAICAPGATGSKKKEEGEVVGTLRAMFFDTLHAVDRDRSVLAHVMDSRDVGSTQQRWTEDHVYYGGNVFAAGSSSRRVGASSK